MSTRDEIMAMDADALRLEVAKALGFKLYDMDFTQIPDAFFAHRHVLKGPGKAPPTSDDDRCIIKELALFRDHQLVGSIVPNWPGDIAAAWALFAEMGHGAYIRHEINGYGDKWHCSFDVPTWYSEDTATLAICRAYLIWKYTP